MGKYLPGRAHLLDEAVFHDDDAVAQRHGLGLVMRDIHKGGVNAFTQGQNLGTHLIAQLGVQIGKGFVHEKHLGLPHDGPADGYALPLAAGQCLGLAVQQLGDIQAAGGFPHLFIDDTLGKLS